MAALAATAFALLYVESDMLWKVQQQNLFLYSSLFFKQQMVVSGGMLSYLGAFFTQFFYRPWVGVLLLSGWWLLLLWLTVRAFRIPDRWNVVTLLPLAVLIVINMDLGYWIYLMKLRGYFFVPTIGTTAAVALLWGFRALPQRLWLRTAYVVVAVVAGYALMGVYALVAALLMAVWTWRMNSCRIKDNVLLTAVALIAVLVVPLLYYSFVYYQTNLVNIYWTALPIFTIFERFPEYYIPYWLLAACYLMFALLFDGQTDGRESVMMTVDAARGAVSTKNPKKRKNKGDRQGERNKGKGKRILHWAIETALLCAMVLGVLHFWYKDDNFHHELRMLRCTEQADWEGVLEEGRKQDCEPTRSIVIMHNLALSRLGRQCDEMYNFQKGSHKSNTRLPIYMYNVGGRMVYYQYGILNECHRMCMEQGVEYGWSVELLQYLARCALLGGERQATRKYLTLLRQTQFYGPWADHMEQLLANPELMVKDKETGPVAHMLNYEDRKGSDNGWVEKNVMMMLSDMDSDDPYFQEQAVLAAMWMRDPDRFWPRFRQYMMLHPNEKIPRIIEEAAILFENLQQNENALQLPFSKEVVESFNAFMKQMEQNRNRPPGYLRSALYPYFGNTYYYEFFFLRDITYF